MDNTTGPAPSRVAESVDLSRLTLSIQDVLDTIPAGAIVVDPLGVMLAVNAEVGRQFGYEPEDLLGRSVDILVPAGPRDGHAALRSKAFGSDQMRAMGPGRSLRGQRRDGSLFQIEVGFRTIATGGSQFVLAVVSDRSDQFRVQESEAHERALTLELEHQEVVAHEMVHRVKNLMATVAALISLSARGAQSAREMEESLRGRILALSSVIDLAFKAPQAASTRGALSVEDVLHAVLAPFMWGDLESSRVSLAGPPLVVKQRPSEVLALVFHELTTNALKYGALQQLDGRILVDWLQIDGELVLCWSEQAADFVALGTTTMGFGTKLMSQLIEGEFSGRIDREVTAQGWLTRITIPLPSLGL
ncbi:HWE histidine kinase domain-containing protein [Devosia sp.]|uniref:HWE histidine kinase domain-containing protein n=1 Tax=Devosia sp. TaxID=1871048 RepID=UPI0027330FF7|nr:HWE histidine kinase domain-containing protein [Devosia sp.]MDP2779383.1 HWE histidine kinase domain-containing protein [Devosia sp.]